MVNTSLFGKLPFNFVRDIAMVAALIRSPLVLQSESGGSGQAPLPDAERRPRKSITASSSVIKETQGARYEISFDGTVRTYRDTREAALEAANVLKAITPSSKVVIRNMRTGAEIDPQKP